MRLIGFLVDRDDEYRIRAAEAQGWADKAKSDEDRAAWLRVVHGWLGLIHRRPETVEKKFDDDVKAQDSDQERTKCDGCRSHIRSSPRPSTSAERRSTCPVK